MSSHLLLCYDVVLTHLAERFLGDPLSLLTPAIASTAPIARATKATINKLHSYARPAAVIHCAMSNRSAISPASARAAASPRQAPAFDAALSRDRSTDEQRRLGARELGGRIEELVDIAVGKLLRQAVDAPRRFVNRAGDRRRLTLQFRCCAVDCARGNCGSPRRRAFCALPVLESSWPT